MENDIKKYTLTITCREKYMWGDLLGGVSQLISRLPKKDQASLLATLVGHIDFGLFAEELADDICKEDVKILRKAIKGK